jgi:predicted DNA-binding transcriptional regulator AlpA
MSELIPFKHDAGQLRIRVDESGNPWFCAADIIAALGLDRKALERLDDDERGVNSIHTLGGEQRMTFVTEPGLYSLILGSRKPEAKRFKRWVTHEVLPAIRKTGRYAVARSPVGLVTLEEVCRLTGYTPAAMRTRIYRGNLPFPLYKDQDGRWRADPAEIEAWVQRVKSGAFGRVMRERKQARAPEPQLPLPLDKPRLPPAPVLLNGPVVTTENFRFDQAHSDLLRETATTTRLSKATIVKLGVELVAQHYGLAITKK